MFKKNKRYYFAFGSNLLEERLIYRVGVVNKIQNYTLYGWKLVFNVGYPHLSSFANIVRTNNQNDFVEGVLYELNWIQESLLSEYEGLYYKEEFVDKSLKATIFAYVGLQEFTIKPEETVLPNLYYLNYILDGCVNQKLDYTYKKLAEYKRKNYKLKRGSRHK